MPNSVWRVKLVAELRPGVTTETEVARIERGEEASLAGLGLRLNEAKQLTAAIQAQIVPTQAAMAGERRRSDPPSASPSPKPKLSAEERRIRQEDRLKSIRLRMAIGHELDDRGITTPAEIGAALGMPAADAIKLMTRHQWREGDVALLEAVAARLGVQVPEPPQLFDANRM
jgi:predicted flap endonuclease-1-like 5' DNA nuclease